MSSPTTPRLSRSMSNTQPTQQVTEFETSSEQTSVRWMSRYKTTAIGHLTKLTHRRTTIQADDSNDVDPTELTSQTSQGPAAVVDRNVTNPSSADNPVQSPRAEPTAPSTIAKRMQDMLSTLPTFNIPSTSPASPSTDSPPHAPNREASKKVEDTPSSPTQNSHPPSSSSLTSFQNGVFDNARKSLWSALDYLRLPYNKPSGSPDLPSQDQILDCIDDNNSVMMYGPLEPDEQSEVEIACSEIVSINGDGEEIRTPQPRYSPLPSEYIDEALVGRGLRSPPPRYVSLPVDSAEESLVVHRLRSPSPRFSPLSLDSVDAPWVAHGLRSPPSHFSPLPLDSVDAPWAVHGLHSPPSHFSPFLSSPVDEPWTAYGLRTPPPRFSPLPPVDADEHLVAHGLRSTSPRFVPLPLESIDQVLMGRGGDAPSGGSEPGGTPEPTGAAQPAAGQPPVREYRIWLPSPTKISIQTMWWGFRVYLPPPVLDILNNRQLEAAKRAAIITTALQWLMEHLPIALLPPHMHPGVTILRHLVPYVGYIGGFIAWGWSAIRSFDKGYGVVLTATWLLPFILIPGTWEAEEAPSQNAVPPPSGPASS